MPGFSSRTRSRFSLAKNMYADNPRLGALGSGQVSLPSNQIQSDRAYIPFLRFSPARALVLRVAFSFGMMIGWMNSQRRIRK